MFDYLWKQLNNLKVLNDFFNTKYSSSREWALIWHLMSYSLPFDEARSTASFTRARTWWLFDLCKINIDLTSSPRRLRVLENGRGF